MNSNIIPEMALRTKRDSINSSSPEVITPLSILIMPPCHSACNRRRSRRIHHPKNNPRPPGEGGPSQTVGEGLTKTLSPNPHPPWRAPSPQGEGLPSLIETVDSATAGKPCVQNDIRVR